MPVSVCAFIRLYGVSSEQFIYLAAIRVSVHIRYGVGRSLYASVQLLIYFLVGHM